MACTYLNRTCRLLYVSTGFRNIQFTSSSEHKICTQCWIGLRGLRGFDPPNIRTKD